MNCAFQDYDNLYLAMELFTGEDLREDNKSEPSSISAYAATTKVSLTYTISNKGIYYVGSYGFTTGADGTTPDITASGGVNIYAISISYEQKGRIDL